MRHKHLFFILSLLVIFSCKQKEENSTAKDTGKAEEAKEKSKESTAQPNVIVIDSLFKIPGLDRTRQIRIYLPPNYEKSDKKYPVVYMHDAQNLFDNATSYAGEWGVDESLNELSKLSDIELIVVGIDNGEEKRMNELSPWENTEFGKAEGKQYMEFIVNTIKPYIDTTYKTQKDREHTAIMGSSMGGLISHYAIYKYPQIFGKAGIFSPSYWYSEKVFDFTKNQPIPEDSRIFLLIGKKEGWDMVKNTRKMNKYIISSHPEKNLKLVVDPKGEHNEAFWRKQFTQAIQWLFK
ncbi:alpha/beta hydrolase [Aquimarina sp. 2304DJ70-9]|uniref:alpha/beta hydrolase n=1 Tax=Aquimarina penaris TaxID=3231044 RepID=UPI003462B71B